ncbi:MAG: hypothetical protein OEY52_08435 [Gammaproteobacteria bacterium]|nr:hypothetical protein [Gammaproteobacteria bacterium]
MAGGNNTKFQWVNLEKNPLYVADGIDSEERLDYLHFDCEFKKAKPAMFKIRLVPVGNQAKYLKSELKRNKNFRKRISVAHSNGGNKKVKLEANAYLPAAGGNKYKVEAKYKGKVIQSKMEVQAVRRLYYQVISMSGVTIPASLQSFEEDFINENNNLFIELIEKGIGSNPMTFIKTVTRIYDPANPSPQQVKLLNNHYDVQFRDAARDVYSIQNYSPYAVAIVFSNYIATLMKTPLEFILNKNANTDPRVSFGNNFITINVVDVTGKNRFLWHNLTGDEIINDPKHWLERGTAVFIDATGRQINIIDNDITINGAQRGAEGGHNQLRINISAALSNFMNNNRVTLKLTVRTVKGFSGGFSYNGLNMITVATKAWWTPSREQKMLQILNHEMGHKIGMVAYGEKKKSKAPYKNNSDFIENKLLPNSPPKLYGENRGVNDQGHLGPHCSAGCNYDKPNKRWSGVPGCVMFGSTGLKDATSGQYNVTPKDFCPDCLKIVRKLDLDGSRIPGLKDQF